LYFNADAHVDRQTVRWMDRYAICPPYTFYTIFKLLRILQEDSGQPREHTQVGYLSVRDNSGSTRRIGTASLTRSPSKKGSVSFLPPACLSVSMCVFVCVRVRVCMHTVCVPLCVYIYMFVCISGARPAARRSAPSCRESPGRTICLRYQEQLKFAASKTNGLTHYPSEMR